MTQGVPATKAELRVRLKSERQRLAADHEQQSQLRAGLTRQVTELVQALGATTVAAYLPFGAEPDIGDFLSLALEMRITLLLPVSQPDGSLQWVNWLGHSQPGIFGFEEPIGEPGNLNEAELVLLPALGVDSHGNRLGKGKGYYDRSLAQLGQGEHLVAVVYDHELLPQIATEPHDKPVHGAITPTKTVWFNG